MAFKVLTSGDKKNSAYYREFVCDTEMDIESLPTNQSPTDNAKIDEKEYCAAGSCALVIETSDVYMLTTDGVWTKL